MKSSAIFISVLITLMVVLSLNHSSKSLRASDFPPTVLEIKKYDMLPCCGVYSKRCVWMKKYPFTIPECEKQNLLKILKWLKSILTVEWGITAGTLLGSARAGRHIEHETDIDITVEKDDRAALVRQIKENIIGTHFVFTPGKLMDRVFFSKDNQVHVDIWTHEKFDLYTLGVTNIAGRGFFRHKMDNSILYPFGTCAYDDERYPCYKDAEKWASLRYGKDWKIPKPKYSPHSTFKDGDDILFEIAGPMQYRENI